MDVKGKKIKREYIVGIFLILVIFSIIFIYSIINNPINFAINWINENYGGFASCAMEISSKDDIDMWYIINNCESASNTKYIFSYEVCGRCPGFLCGDGEGIILLTDDTQLLAVYNPYERGNIFRGVPNPPTPIKYCKEIT